MLFRSSTQKGLLTRRYLASKQMDDFPQASFGRVDTFPQASFGCVDTFPRPVLTVDTFSQASFGRVDTFPQASCGRGHFLPGQF